MVRNSRNCNSISTYKPVLAGEEMNRLLLTIGLICGLAISGAHAADNTVVSPDLSALQKRTVALVAERWKNWNTTFMNYEPAPSLKRVEIRMIRRADDLLTNTSIDLQIVNPLEDKPVYLVHAIARPGFWKIETEHLLVFHAEKNDWNALLHFSGGWNGRGIDFETINLGVSSREQALLIHYYACGNQMSQTHTYIYRYDKDENGFVEIFNQLTTWLPSVKPIVYKSELSFEKSGSALKDIVVRTKLVKQRPVRTKFKMRRRSVFKWDGKRYSGKMDLPITVE